MNADHCQKILALLDKFSEQLAVLTDDAQQMKNDCAASVEQFFKNFPPPTAKA
jgi:hypothetical protein